MQSAQTLFRAFGGTLNTQRIILKVTEAKQKNLVVRVGRHLTTMTTKTAADVIHNKEKCEFTLKLSEDERGKVPKAELSYAWVDAGHMDMYHTGVPPVYRGQGIAKLLAKAAFDFAVEADVKVTLTCTYLQKYFRENPLAEYKKRVI